MVPLNIMTVDDSMITLKKLGQMLEELGHRVVASAATGAEAVEKYAQLEPDLVTMDITMPDMDGIEATGRILAAHPGALIIMVTSHGQQEMVLEAVKKGAKGYVLKPFNKENLKDMIAKVVKKYK